MGLFTDDEIPHPRGAQLRALMRSCQEHAGNRRRPLSSLDDMPRDRAYSGLRQNAAGPLGGLPPAQVPPIQAEELSKQAGVVSQLTTV